ncbi:DPP IV N-terminal domain-containing protein [Prevotella sp. S7 MS 2]|uniref:S9 family peptidase n=1 Tax=Prevotella sp. S7 MS 2 TaxID=1287488 RepID=UPI00051340D1|nr:DPP IV N-terminal domain-containing protein [Prevotella sp. S7 MS 2]KGI61444.1 prolyl tripeptidyl peptidase [Prevotella sp. S7 MS 2]
MKIKSLLTILFIATTTMSQAQLKHFTLEDLNFGGNNYYNMVPQNRYTTWWGDQLVRLDADACKTIDAKNGKEKILFNLSDVNKHVADSLGKVHSLYYAEFPYSGKTVVLLTNMKSRLLYDFRKKSVVWSQSLTGQEHADWNAISKAVAYVKDSQLYVKQGNRTVQLTTDGSNDIVYGQSVHRDEFGISKGTYWSNDGNKLAFYRMDQSMVASFPLVDIPENDWKPQDGQSRMATPAPLKYPMAGETSHKVTVGVYDLQSGHTVYLKAGDPTDRYFTNISWSPDSKIIYMFELNRDQNDCRLVSYNATTGDKIAELYRETDSKYVEPQHPIVFLPWDHSKFIMQSQKDGYNHLYLFSSDGTQLKQITQGNWVVMDVLGFNTKRRAIIISSNECKSIQKNTWLVDIETGKRALMDNGAGWHTAKISTSGQYILDNYSEPTVPRNIDIMNTENGKHIRYFTAVNPWKDYDVPEYSCGSLKAADGTTDLYYRMVKPTNFDPTKKYPTIIYVYGGPHAHNVDARWHYASRGWETFMAQSGYLLFILDNRGSENRGKAFEQATFRQLGQEEMKDQMQGIAYLKTLPYVDADKIGVHGWSFGGFMTTSLMTNYPDVFKVGVAGGPVIDWKWYEVMYGERYMDTPQNNPEGYGKTSLIKQAKNLKGKLQIIIGENDPVVVPQHAKAFIHQCILDGTQPDFFMYPGEPHNMRGHQSTHLHKRISQYFFDYLPVNK